MKALDPFGHSSILQASSSLGSGGEDSKSGPGKRWISMVPRCATCHDQSHQVAPLLRMFKAVHRQVHYRGSPYLGRAQAVDQSTNPAPTRSRLAPLAAAAPEHEARLKPLAPEWFRHSCIIVAALILNLLPITSQPCLYLVASRYDTLL